LYFSVQGRAFPDHPAWLAKSLAVIGTRIERQFALIAANFLCIRPENLIPLLSS